MSKNSNSTILKKDVGNATLLQGDSVEAMQTLDSDSVYCCVTSPPYWGLRDYKVNGQIGTEKKPEEYINNLVRIFKSLKRVLRSDGSLWLNLGDTYNNKQLMGIPWRVALALQDDGWKLRADIIWEKPNAMPQSVKDRPSISHEYVFLLTKNLQYHYDANAIMEPLKPGTAERYSYGFGKPSKKQDLVTTGKWHAGNNGRDNLCGDIPLNKNGRNKRSVWTIPTKSYKGAHFATFPPKLVEPCILAGSPEKETVIDVFAGSGTTGEVAILNNRRFIGIELNEQYYNDLLYPRMKSLQKEMALNI